MAKPQRHVFVCTQNRPANHPRGSCGAKQSTAVLQAFWGELQQRNAYEQVAITYAGCLGPCDAGPGDVAEIFTRHLQGGEVVERLLAPALAWS
jgi:(2Fe-2S) ferredoxin